jgi:hypothetical protein
LGVRPVANRTASAVRTGPVDRVTVSLPSFRQTVFASTPRISLEPV